MRRRVLALSALVAATAIAVGSAGFTSAGADRSVSVTTATDENAYLSLDTATESEAEADDGDTIALVTVKNQFSEEVDVTITEVTADRNNLAVSVSEQPGTLAIGDSEPVKVHLDCASAQSQVTATISFHVEADGDGVAVDTTEPRTVDARCNP